MAASGKRRCTAKSKRSGKRCANWAIKGRRTCRMHGGKSPRGRDHPSYKHGLHTKSLPERYRARYGEHLVDDRVFSLDPEVALIQTRMDELLAGLDVDGHVALWIKLKAACDELQRATKSKEHDSARNAIGAVCSLVDRGRSESRTWVDIHALQIQKTKTLEVRSRIAKQEQASIPEAHLFVIMDRFAEVVRTEITKAFKLELSESDTLRNISTALKGQVFSGSSGEA